jgi:hypothetical protein
MAQIPVYDEQVQAGGSIQAQSNPNDFGANIGQAIGNVGAGIGAIANTEYRLSQDEGRLQAATDIEKVKYDAQEWYTKQKAQLDPLNDPNYTDKVSALSNQFQQYMDSQKQNYLDANGNKTYQRMFNAHMSNLTWSMQTGVNHDIAASAGAAVGVKVQNLSNASLDAVRGDSSEENVNRIVQKFDDAIGNIQVPGFDDKHKIELHEKFLQQVAQTAWRTDAAKDPYGVHAALGMSGEAIGKNGPKGGTFTANPGEPPATVQQPAGGFGTPNVPTQVAQYSGVAASAGKNYGVDPNFLLAQINAESGGRTAAVSPAGATGVSQMMPSTAAQLKVNTSDPTSSVQGQAQYMSTLLKQFGNDYSKAAAAYNWGPGNLTAAISKYGDQWQQHLPTETTNYLNKIFSSLPQQPNNGVTPTNQPQPPRELTDGELIAATPQSPSTLKGQLWSMLTDQQRVEIGRLAEQGIRADQIAKQQNEAMYEKALKVQQDKTNNDYLNKLIDGTLTVSDIRGDTVLTAQQREHWYNAITADNGPANKTDPAVFNSLFMRIHAPDGTPNKITDVQQVYQFLGRGITAADVGKLNNEIRDKGQPDADLLTQFKSMAKAQISGSSLIAKDPEGDKQFYNWNAYADNLIKDKRAQGISLHQMLDPQDKNYIGSTINNFVRSPQQQMKDMSDRLKGAPIIAPLAPDMLRKPNETIEAWKARTKQ